jgi:hypothetical protein
VQHSDSLPADYAAAAPQLQRGVSFAAGDTGVASTGGAHRRATRARYLFQLLSPKEIAKLHKDTCASPKSAGERSRFAAFARWRRVACVFRVECLAVQVTRHAGASPLARVEARALQVCRLGADRH